MARPTPPGKRTRISVLDAIVVIVVVCGGVLAIIRYNWLAISRLAHSLPNVNSQIVGEWKSTRGPEHLVFRTDKTVSMTVAANLAQDSAAPAAPETGSPTPAAPETNGPAPVTGEYQLAQGGKVVIQLMGGKKYTTTISPGNQNRFDLIDSATEAVTTFERVPSAFQTLHRSLRPNRLAAGTTTWSPLLPDVLTKLFRLQVSSLSRSSLAASMTASQGASSPGSRSNAPGGRPGSPRGEIRPRPPARSS